MSKPVNPQWLVDRFPNDLKAQVRYLVNKGYQVIQQESGSAQLLKKKSFSCLFCILTGVIPYFIWYMAKRDRTVYLDMTDQKPKAKTPQTGLKASLSEWYDEVGLLGVLITILFVYIVFSIASSYVSNQSQTNVSSSTANTATTPTK